MTSVSARASISDRNGRRASTKRFLCSTGRPELIVLFVPGNPGILDVYHHFLKAIFESAPKRIEVSAIAHLGHDPSCPLSFAEASRLRGPPLPTLQDAVDVEVAFLDKVLAEAGGHTPIVLIGHSVGGWLTTKLLQARPQDIAAAYLLFPSLSELALTPGGVRLTPILTRTGIALTFLVNALIALFLPFWMLEHLVGLVVRSKDHHARLALASFLSRPCCGAAALALAVDEFVQIRKLDAGFLRRYADRLSVYWCEGDLDPYVPDSSATEVNEVLESVDPQGLRTHRRVRCERGIRHAFSLQSSEAMSRTVIDWLAEDFLNERLKGNN